MHKSDRPRPSRRDASDKVIVEAIDRAFNTWAFKREQPSDAELLQRCIASAVARGAPIPFVLYWGKGPRAEFADCDGQCLDYLASLSKRIAQRYPPGAIITLVCTDTHALHNGHSALSIQSYFTAIERAAATRHFACCRLGTLTPTTALAEMLPVVDEIPSETMQRLVRAAHRWYKGDGTAIEGARSYYRMNMTEKRAIERAFPETIFITFNGSDCRPLFPEQLPIFYMYSLKRGTSTKPWFMNADGSSAEPPSPQSAELATA